MEKRKPFLLAVTHNYIGETFKGSRPNEVIESEVARVLPISGEHLLLLDPPKPGDQRNREWLIEQVRNPEIAQQKPDFLLLYIGASDAVQALEFASLFTDAKVHIVANDSPVALDKLEKAFLSRNKGRSGRYQFLTLHFAETTGNVTMEELVEEFLEFGRL